MIEFEMTETDLAALYVAMRPVPLIALQCGMPASQQENANLAWENLGMRMGFKPYTVRPLIGKGPRFFMAEPTGTTNA